MGAILTSLTQLKFPFQISSIIGRYTLSNPKVPTVFVYQLNVNGVYHSTGYRRN
jgi:hypothetical protein